MAVTFDFGTLLLGIENCAALPLITPAKLALYLDWVREADYARNLPDDHDTRFAWQDYSPP